MTIRAKGLRASIAGLAVCALAFHALVMGLGTAPRTSAEHALLTALAEICSATAQHGAADPSGPHVPSPSHEAPCALCGLGHAGVDLPSLIALAPPASAVETLALGPRPCSAPPQREFLASARPRAPPAFV